MGDAMAIAHACSLCGVRAKRDGPALDQRICAVCCAAKRLVEVLKDVLADLGRGGGSRFEREVAEVLRAVQRGAGAESGDAPDSRRYLDLVGRVLGHGAPS